jgi:hypothetical protein
VVWGANTYRQRDVPAGLTNVVAIDGSEKGSLALSSDGRLMAWGDNSSGQTNVPATATNVLAISSGGDFDGVLQNDGKLLIWGNGSSGQTNTPAGLSNVVNLALGTFHGLALTSDGKPVAWGYNGDGQTAIPTGASNVLAVAAGYRHSMALIGGLAPFVARQPLDRAAYTSNSVALNVGVVGVQPLAYQWFRGGTNIIGATNALLVMEGLQIGDTGDYSLFVSNSFGTVVSSNLHLTVTFRRRRHGRWTEHLGSWVVTVDLSVVAEQYKHHQRRNEQLDFLDQHPISRSREIFSGD